jgi:hypothetical protein
MTELGALPVLRSDDIFRGAKGAWPAGELWGPATADGYWGALPCLGGFPMVAS